MPILIDGYNVLFAQDDLQELMRSGKPLADARDALMRQFSEQLGELRTETIVVFDAVKNPPQRPSHTKAHGIRVCFAERADGADSMIESLITSAAKAKELTVVSGDHRIQNAARKRGARAITSERFMQELDRGQLASQATETEPDAKYTGPSPEESARWVEEFKDLAHDPNFRELFIPPGFDDEEVIP